MVLGLESSRGGGGGVSVASEPRVHGHCSRRQCSFRLQGQGIGMPSCGHCKLLVGWLSLHFEIIYAPKDHCISPPVLTCMADCRELAVGTQQPGCWLCRSLS
jgi:hypothetical protein